MSFYNSEEEFLSIYTAFKLINGGAPVVSNEELISVRDRFLHTFYCPSSIVEDLKLLSFDNLQQINERFQQRVTSIRPKNMPCFVLKNDKLFPTYNFFDFTQTKNNPLTSFLLDERFMSFQDSVQLDSIIANKSYLISSRKVANFITDFFAKIYLDKEISNGKYPNAVKYNYNFFEEYIDNNLELKETKAFFEKFYNYVFVSVATLLSNNNGNLILSNNRFGNLKYNNMKRILNKFPLFERMYTTYPDNRENKFDIIIKNGVIQSQIQPLFSECSYDNISNNCCC